MIEGTYIISGKYAVRVDYFEALSEFEFYSTVEYFQEIGAVAIPNDPRNSVSKGDLEVERIFQATIEDRDQAIEDLLNSAENSDERIEAQSAVEENNALLETYMRVWYGDYRIVIDNDIYKKHCGSEPTFQIARDLIEYYAAFASNECQHMIVVPLNIEGWEDLLSFPRWDEISEIGGAIIPVPELSINEVEAVQILNDNGYQTSPNPIFVGVDL